MGESGAGYRIRKHCDHTMKEACTFHEIQSCTPNPLRLGLVGDMWNGIAFAVGAVFTLRLP